MITVDILKKHIKGDISIGSFPIYNRWHSLYCRFISVDIDFHSDRKKDLIFGVDDTLKGLAFKKLEEIYNESEKYFFITNDSIFVEDSGGGYHIWIILKDLTTLKNTQVYVEHIRPKLQEQFNGIDDAIEIFPKQRFEDYDISDGRNFDLIKNPGNAIKLPYGLNFKRARWSKIVLGNPLKVIPVDITPICKEMKFRLSRFDTVKLGSTTKKLKKPLEARKIADVDLQFYYKHYQFKPCFKAIIDGSAAATGHNGNILRVGLANELYHYNAPMEVIIKAFENQKDFTFEKTKYHIERCIHGIKTKGNPLRLRCDSIKKLGFCLENCWKLGRTSKRVENEEDGHNLPSMKGWDGLHAANDKIIQMTNKRYYYYKTTRSGTTTSVIIKALQHKRKILMIAPLINIFKITVNNALEIGKKDGYFGKSDKFFIHRVRSNFEVCSKIKKQFGKIEGIQDVFPFFHKGYCDKCGAKMKSECEYQKFLDNLESYDLIYLTVKKFNALIKGGDASQVLLRRLLTWSDVIFVDECSNIFDAEWESIEIWAYKDTILIDRIGDWKKTIQTFLSHYSDWIGSTQINALTDYIEFVEEKLDDLKDVQISHYISFDNKFHDTLDVPQKIAFYQQLIKFYEDTRDYEIKYLVECFLTMSRKTIYLQLIVPLRDPKYVIMASVNDIDTMVKYLNDYTKDKLLLLTDATEPPIRLEKCFEDLDYIYVNDPLETAKQQIIYIIPNPTSFMKLTSGLENDIIDIMDRYAINKNEPVFMVAQSIRIMNFILKLSVRVNRTENKHWEVKHMDYFRGKTTKGTPSDLRRMIVFGSARPPAHCYDYVAAIYIKAGYLDKFKSADEAGKYLEMYSAQSAFFQTISRVKCPEGKERSIVYTYGCGINEIKSWLDMKIATPRVIQL